MAIQAIGALGLSSSVGVRKEWIKKVKNRFEYEGSEGDLIEAEQAMHRRQFDAFDSIVESEKTRKKQSDYEQCLANQRAVRTNIAREREAIREERHKLNVEQIRLDNDLQMSISQARLVDEELHQIQERKANRKSHDQWIQTKTSQREEQRQLLNKRLQHLNDQQLNDFKQKSIRNANNEITKDTFRLNQLSHSLRKSLLHKQHNIHTNVMRLRRQSEYDNSSNFDITQSRLRYERAAEEAFQLEMRTIAQNNEKHFSSLKQLYDVPQTVIDKQLEEGSRDYQSHNICSPTPTQLLTECNVTPQHSITSNLNQEVKSVTEQDAPSAEDESNLSGASTQQIEQKEDNSPLSVNIETIRRENQLRLLRQREEFTRIRRQEEVRRANSRHLEKEVTDTRRQMTRVNEDRWEEEMQAIAKRQQKALNGLDEQTQRSMHNATHFDNLISADAINYSSIKIQFDSLHKQETTDTLLRSLRSLDDDDFRRQICNRNDENTKRTTKHLTVCDIIEEMEAAQIQLSPTALKDKLNDSRSTISETQAFGNSDPEIPNENSDSHSTVGVANTRIRKPTFLGIDD